MLGTAHRRDELKIKNNFDYIASCTDNAGGEFLSALLDEAAFIHASDLHISAGTPVYLRIDGELIKINNLNFNSEQINNALQKIITPESYKFFNKNYELDFGFFSDGAKAGRIRVRGSCYRDVNGIAIALRILPVKIPDLNELNLPEILKSIAQKRGGLFLTAGAAGSGKSTTLAAILNEINNTRREHIITIEDPIEYIFEPNLCLIHQREVNLHTKNFYSALKYALRQDPNIIMIGEMRDAETISAAVTAAETGHLVLSSLHTQDAAQGIERLIAAFPENNQSEARVRIASVLTGIIAQKLVPKRSDNPFVDFVDTLTQNVALKPKGEARTCPTFRGDVASGDKGVTHNSGRICAAEICIANNAVRNLIREGKTHNIKSIIQTGISEGMRTLEQSLAELVHRNFITPETALSYANYPAELERIL